MVGDFDVLGKSVGSDKNESKITYVTKYGIDKSKQMIHDLYEEAISHIHIFGNKKAFLIDLFKYTITRNN